MNSRPFINVYNQISMAPEPRPRRSCRHRNSGNPNVNIPSGSPSYHNRRSNANVDVNNGQTSVSWTGDQGSTFNLNSGTGGTNVNYSSNGSGDDTDCSDDEDNHSSGGSGSSGYNPYSTSTSTSGAESLPNSAQLVKAGGDDGNKLAPIAIIVPVVVGVALLLLGIGFFVIWRKRRAAAREGSVEEASGENANAGSQAEMRGGEGQMTGTVIGLVGPTKVECVGGF